MAELLRWFAFGADVFPLFAKDNKETEDELLIEFF
jgi:hypothetical protein